MQIGFIGAGKVGFSLGKYFRTHGISVTGYYSRNPQSAREAATFTNSRSFAAIETVIQESDTLFLTVPDGEIANVWGHIRNLSVKNKKICHCSGCMSASVFDGIEALGAFGYSVHPLYAINSKRCSYEELSRAIFTLEGSSFYLQEMKELLEIAGNSVQLITGDKKELYHGAAVFASNFMVALGEVAQNLLRQCGFTEELARRALNPLMLGNVQQICQVGTVAALTGPAERGDIVTIQKHLDCLPPQERELYRLLTEQLIILSEKKHPNRSYEPLTQMISVAKQEENHEKYSEHL